MTAQYCLARTLMSIAFCASFAGAQEAPAPTTAQVAARDSMQVKLTPVRPTQGSIVRITIQPRAASILGGIRADSLVGADSLARTDSLAGADSLRLESLRQDILRLDSLRIDSVRTHALAPDSPRADSLTIVRADSVTRTPAPRGADSARATDSARVADAARVMDSARISNSARVTDSARTADSAIVADSSAQVPADSDPVIGRIAAIRGMLFGEPLHFLPLDSGGYFALGGIPVDAPASVSIPLIVDRVGGVSDTMNVQLDIERVAYRMERLTVAPKFGQAPNPALAARIAREQALAAEVSRRSHDTPRLWTGDFSRPREARVTSRFGDGRQFNGAVQSRHMGLDLAGALGAPVLAADRGVVALVGDFYYAGNAVYIDHGTGLVTAYFHLSRVDVAKGDTVSAGDRIGRVGATGRVTGPHLHWVARYGSVTVDPSSLLEIGPIREDQ